jgi:hypothetical protein
LCHSAIASGAPKVTFLGRIVVRARRSWNDWRFDCSRALKKIRAGVAQLVEHHVANVVVVSSNLIARSSLSKSDLVNSAPHRA